MPRRKAIKYSAAVEKADTKEELMRRARLALRIASEETDAHQILIMKEIANAYMRAAKAAEQEMDNGG